MSLQSAIDADFLVNDQGSIIILTPTSEAAIEWCDTHLPDDAQRWGPNGYVVEHRYIQDIIDGLEADGFQGRAI